MKKQSEAAREFLELQESFLKKSKEFTTAEKMNAFNIGVQASMMFELCALIAELDYKLDKLLEKK